MNSNCHTDFFINNDPLISIIVPVYNAAPYLRKCLDSICCQTYQNIEIICVNDGSTDGSNKILEEYAAKDQRITVLHQKNSGPSVARNAALDTARGEFIMGVDSDDYLLQTTCEQLLPLMTDEVDVLVMNAQMEGPPTKRLKHLQDYYTMKNPAGIYELNSTLIFKITNSFWGKLYRRSIIEKHHLRFRSGVWYEDFPYKIMYLCYCKNVYMYPHALYHRIIRDDSITGQVEHGAVKVLDRYSNCYELYKFLSRNDMLKQWPGIDQALCNTMLRITGELNTELRPLSVRFCRKYIKKCGFHIQFANDPRIKALGFKTLQQRVRELFYKRKDKKQSFRILGVPVMTINKKNGTKKWKILGVTIYKKSKS